MAVDTSLSFGQRLRRLRRDAGLTQEALAEQAGLSVRTVSDLERGLYRRPHEDTVQLLADALRLNADQRSLLEAAGGRGSSSAARPRVPVAKGPLTGDSTRTTPPTNLLDEPTPFIGREREIRQAADLLQTPAIRLVTLTGPGGIGKTRLALQVAAALLPGFRDGAFFVNLAPLTDPALVPSSIADVLGVKEEGNRDLAEILIAALRGKHLLLVLDNFEHLLPAGTLVSSLLDACTEVHILVTSRIPLHLSREYECPVPSLSVPEVAHPPALDRLVQYEAVALFVERARAVKPEFVVTGENAAAVAEICSRLDGLPLAIELAAARIKLFPPPALLARLSRSLTVLTGGARDRPSRHRTLRAAIDWSYSLLTPPEQILFARLSVFVGGCTLEAAEAVCNLGEDLDLLEGMANLLNESLLRQEGNEEPRFAMLETIREYARERLEEGGKRDDLRKRHAQWCLGLVEEAVHEISDPHQAEWLEREQGNLRAALHWAGDNRMSELGLRLAIALSPFWRIRGYLVEGQGWLTMLLDGAGNDIAPVLRARALLWTGDLVFVQGREHAAAELFEQSLDLFRELDDMGGVAEALDHLSLAVLPYGNETGDRERVISLLTEYLAVGREQNNRRLLATTLCRLAYDAVLHGDNARASRLGEESLALYRRLGDAQGTLTALCTVAEAAYRAGDLQRGRAGVSEILDLLPHLAMESDPAMRGTISLALASRDRGDYGLVEQLVEARMERAAELGDVRSATLARAHLGTFAREQGDYARARTLAQESLAVFQDREDLDGMALALLVLSGIARDLGDAESVIELSEQALTIMKGSGIELFSSVPRHDLGLAARYRGDYERAAALLEESLAIVRARGWLMASPEFLAGLGGVALEQKHYERAHHLYVEALQTCRTWMDGTILEGLASAAAGRGHAKRAACLFGAAEMIRSSMGVPRWPANQALYQLHVSLTREALAEESFTRHWEEGRALTSEEAVAYALNQAPDTDGGE